MIVALIISFNMMISLCLYQMVNSTSLSALRLIKFTIEYGGVLFCYFILCHYIVLTHWTTVTGSCAALSTRVTGRLATPAHGVTLACFSEQFKSRIIYNSTAHSSHWGGSCFYACWKCRIRSSTLCSLQGVKKCKIVEKWYVHTFITRAVRMVSNWVEITDSTETSIRLNSSIQPQAPHWARPLRILPNARKSIPGKKDNINISNIIPWYLMTVQNPSPVSPQMSNWKIPNSKNTILICQSKFRRQYSSIEIKMASTVFVPKKPFGITPLWNYHTWPYLPSPQLVTIHRRPKALAKSLVVSVLPVPAGPGIWKTR